jgi:hypothetical protein
LQVALQLILRSHDELERAGASHLMHSLHNLMMLLAAAGCPEHGCYG